MTPLIFFKYFHSKSDISVYFERIGPNRIEKLPGHQTDLAHINGVHFPGLNTITSTGTRTKIFVFDNTSALFQQWIRRQVIVWPNDEPGRSSIHMPLMTFGASSTGRRPELQKRVPGFLNQSTKTSVLPQRDCGYARLVGDFSVTASP